MLVFNTYANSYFYPVLNGTINMFTLSWIKIYPKAPIVLLAPKDYTSSVTGYAIRVLTSRSDRESALDSAADEFETTGKVTGWLAMSQKHELFWISHYDVAYLRSLITEQEKL